MIFLSFEATSLLLNWTKEKDTNNTAENPFFSKSTQDSLRFGTNESLWASSNHFINHPFFLKISFTVCHLRTTALFSLRPLGDPSRL